MACWPSTINPCSMGRSCSDPPVKTMEINCGSWLACDGITSVLLIVRVAGIAGKPAPTGNQVCLIESIPNPGQKKRQPEGWRFYAALNESLRLLATKTWTLAGTGWCTTTLARWRVIDQFQARALFRRWLGWAFGAGAVVGTARSRSTTARLAPVTATARWGITTTTGWTRSARRTFAILTGRCRRTTLAFDMRLAGDTTASGRCIQRRAQGAGNTVGACHRTRRFTLHTLELVFALGVHLRHGHRRQADFGTQDVDFGTSAGSGNRRIQP